MSMTHRKQRSPKKHNKIVHSERRFLEGPRSRRREFKFVFKVMWEFIKGFQKLHFAGPCVTVFGSARFKEDHQYYKIAQEMGGKISKLGFTVLTGGGPGIMEAANRRAFEAGGKSIGCNIVLPHEQKENPYVRRTRTVVTLLSQIEIVLSTRTRDCARDIHTFQAAGL